MPKRGLLPIALGLLWLAAPAATPAPADEAVPGVRGEFAASLKDAGDKIVELAQAMPQSKYSWRPMKGVRSTAEVYLHMASANFGIPALMGVKPPAGVDIRNLEQSTTDKEKIVGLLHDSFAHARKALADTPDAELERTVRLFDHDGTVREAMLLIVAHAHEHLGQSIAFARSCNVVPPWTAREQAAAKKDAGGK
jgi:uncharacterized damage-inducible protein DinB